MNEQDAIDLQDYTLLIPVFGGVCHLGFDVPLYTGPQGSGTYPGVGFTFIADKLTPALIERRGRRYGGMGVISRTDAQRLVDLLTKFLAEHPPRIDELMARAPR